jgi:2-oxoglutarate ferredoxin oxidoreductase subunit beta
MNYCPGCGHGTITRLVAEAIEERGIIEKTIGIASVGCSAFIFDFIEVDFIAAPHGRATAVGVGVKRARPDKIVFTYQGDGDLAAIGTSESVHVANRGDSITVIFVNNGIYGMTGGQMAPTTIEGMKSSTTPYGRDIELTGNPLNFTNMAANLPGTYFVTRQAVHTPAAVRRAKKALLKAFEYQEHHKGLCLVEFVSTCNMNWKMSPVEANKWMEENMFQHYPLGDLKEKGELVKK